MRAVLVSVGLLAACATACESKPDLPENHNYLIGTKNLDYVGATVLVGDRRVTFDKKVLEPERAHRPRRGSRSTQRSAGG